jgi:glycine/D-amino acid oxidase-like deaminating enzyme
VGPSLRARVEIKLAPLRAAWLERLRAEDRRERDAEREAIAGELDVDARLKAAKAERAEIELSQLRGDIVTVAAAFADCRRLVSAVREGAEELGRRFGRDAQRLVLDKLDDVADEWGGSDAN